MRYLTVLICFTLLLVACKTTNTNGINNVTLAVSDKSEEDIKLEFPYLIVSEELIKEIECDSYINQISIQTSNDGLQNHKLLKGQFLNACVLSNVARGNPKAIDLTLEVLGLYNAVGMLYLSDIKTENFRGEKLFLYLLKLSEDYRIDYEDSCSGNLPYGYSIKWVAISMIDSINGMGVSEYIKIKRSENRYKHWDKYKEDYAKGLGSIASLKANLSILNEAWENDLIKLKPFEKQN